MSTDGTNPPDDECKRTPKAPFVFSEELRDKGFSKHTSEAFMMFVRSTPLEEGFLLTTNARLDEVLLKFIGDIDPDFKQAWSCRACLKFLREIGSTVTVNPDGSLSSPFWSREPPWNSGGYAELIETFERIVCSAEITGYYSRRKRRAGNDTMKPFGHLYATVGEKHRSRLQWQSDGEVRGRIQDYHKQLINVVGSVPKDRLIAFTAALETRAVALARPLAHAKWILTVIEGFEAAGPEKDINYLWRQAVLAPLGYPGWNSSLLKMGFDKFEAEGKQAAIDTLLRELNPVRYQVETRTLTKNRLDIAAKKLKDTGAETALCQRYATADDIQEWRWKASLESLECKDVETPGSRHHNIPKATVSCDDFVQHIAPKAQALWFEVNPVATSRSLCIFACASDPDSVPLLAWDSEEKRNTVSLGVWVNGAMFKNMGFTTQYNRIVGITSHPATWHGRKSVINKAPIFVFEGPTKESVHGLIFKSHINSRFRDQAGTIATVVKSMTLDSSVDPIKRLRGYWGDSLGNNRIVALIDGQYIRYKLSSSAKSTGDADTTKLARDESTSKKSK